RSSIWAYRCRQALAAYPQASGGQPSNACAEAPWDFLLGLAPGGVYRATPVTRGAGGLLHHRFTLTWRVRQAVCFLWHCPAGHPGLPLTTTLLCGARTFLGEPFAGFDAAARSARPPRSRCYADCRLVALGTVGQCPGRLRRRLRSPHS